MFDRIAHRYDLLNHLLSANRDVAWRQRMADFLPQGDSLNVLDLATGTADQLLALYNSGRVKSGIGLDLSEKMMAIGREKIAKRELSDRLSLQKGDAEEIPLNDESFDAVSISFGIRNVTDVNKALREMYRVLRPNGRALILEFSIPRSRLIRYWYLFYFRFIMPVIGGLVSGDDSAYRYLNETVETFPYGKDFCRLMSDAGFNDVKREELTFGIASIYCGEKL
ncbi:MAG: bifunctional demethylmenaquinone methyltransferase/2-methoxy-6-polyprenyl-1,4-benzoquinol methylase UbiE [Candidatus Zixiibacteriota bacterium]|nr:MAG: bifunctional demethylmenaquinone methyltransferase/2-methoxy-6-polyprenyl-1,4-benzoquinol methylase UbiE [candidate division Zixibacteria bacterium]